MRIGTQTANIHASAALESETTSQALFGERVKVIQADQHWSYIELLTDGYTGHMQNQFLQHNSTESTHRVIARSTLLFSQPDIKSRVHHHLSFASELSLQHLEDSKFAQTHDGYFIWKAHTSALESTLPGHLIDTAQSMFLGAPYLWGGRSPTGIDCSGVVQLSAMVHGWSLPRDTKDQLAYFYSGEGATKIEYADKRLNDLIYWPGHVAIVLNPTTVVHATAHSLECCRESLAAVEARAGMPESIWRLTPPH